MRALVQRVKRASVQFETGETRSIGPGLLIFLGVHETDEPQLCEKLAKKCAQLRIFDDQAGKLNMSAVQLGYSAMVIPNFTLYADTHKGRRPSFITAAGVDKGRLNYTEFVRIMRKQGLKDVQTGEFGAGMQVELINDGPITLMLDTQEWETQKD